ncbi:MAG: SDR family oxidoreductase [Sphingorhabdus sp.]|nr:SDR family oxidoreductase [Sphingorhabdus sp.]
MSDRWIDLSGQVAVVTGAASGIGRAACVALAAAGAKVIALDMDMQGVQAVATEIGGAAHGLDVTSEAEWRAVAGWIETEFGRLDILVNSAGIAISDSVGDADLTNYHKTFAVNVEGTLLGMQVALEFMRKQGKGSIVNLASTASLKGNPIMASYGASKATVAHFTRSAALQNARSQNDIRINAVLPGLVETAMAGDFYDIFEKIGSPDAVRGAFTTGRSARAEEIADVILFLASDRASFVSGASIVVDRAASA